MICQSAGKHTARHNQKQQNQRRNRLALQAFSQSRLLNDRLVLLPAGADHPESRVVYLCHADTPVSFMRGSMTSLTVCAAILVLITSAPVISTRSISRL